MREDWWPREAEAWLRRAVEIVRAKLGRNDAEVTTGLHDMGVRTGGGEAGGGGSVAEACVGDR